MTVATADVEKRLQSIKIVCVTSVPFFLVSQLKGQVTYLSRTGMRVNVLTSDGPELEQIEWTDSLSHEVVEIRRKPSLWCDVQALLQLVKIFRASCPTIVHSTTPKAGLLTALAAWIARVPVRLHTFTGQPWITMSGPMRWISRLSDRLICRLTTQCYADSPSQRSFLIEEGIASPGQIGVLGAGSLAGVDMTRFDQNRFSYEDRDKIRHALGVSDEAKVLLFIGRVTRDKGIAELLAAFRGLRDSGIKVDLVLVGPMEIGENGGDAFLRDEVAQEGVHLVGYSETPEQYLAIADFMCLPSYREGFGTVVIEAAAMQIPTVGTQITGLSDAIVDGETGILVPPRDPIALGLALRKLLESPQLREDMGKAAYERCLRNFDSRVVNERLVEEYARLLKQAGLP